ncbi:MAG: GNAT family N-acetyltransferase [Ketobacteraceae bacterium]|nr:GNAT family N-acetyltransferase [Ketobacteraceae bacterium]
MNASNDIVHDAESKSFEIKLADGSVASLSYRLNGNTAYYEHTYVPESFQGKGIAAKLTRAALLEARKKQWKVVPVCSYVDQFIRRNPEFSDIAGNSVLI